MKKLLGFFALTAMLSANAFIGTVGRSANVAVDGSIVVGTNEQQYINVVNRSGGALLRGALVVPDLTYDDGVSVTTSITQNHAPLCVLEVACSSGSLCKCQTYGYHSAVLLEATGAVGASAGNQGFISVNTAGYVKGIVPGSISAQDNPVGTFYDASGVSGTVEMFLKIR